MARTSALVLHPGTMARFTVLCVLAALCFACANGGHLHMPLQFA